MSATPRPSSPSIPSCSWRRPIGQGWDAPYRVRYPSNLDDGPWHGMPLGGFGAGCVGRSHAGEFNLWHLDAGEHSFGALPACQFAVFEQVGDQAQIPAQTQTYALSTHRPTDGTLSAWRWYPAASESHQTGTYDALYPRSWFTYENVFQTQLTCEQFSPILAQNYQETSYPVAVFEWSVHNPTDQAITLSILMSWQNLAGWFTNAAKSAQVQVRDDGSPVYEYRSRWGESGGNCNRVMGDEQRLGMIFGRDVSAEQQPEEGDGEWAIATLLNPVLAEAFYHSRWNPSGDGSDLWAQFSLDGSLPDIDDETPAADGEQIAGAIAVRITLRPGQTQQIPFVLTWDLPVMEFAEGITYYRRYTDFFGRSGQNAWAIARTALKQRHTWRSSILAWQAPILDRPDLPDWFKLGLFNELYDLTDGGALWSAADERDPVGQFAVLECIDYRWYESLDVRLYGSFGLLLLWPKLEKAVVEAFARAIPNRDGRTRTIGYYFTLGLESPQAERKTQGATPHDLGAPNEHVWEKTNYTSYQDCNLWKDLPSDFVLQVYRDYLLTGANDLDFVRACWPAVVETLHYLKTFDLDLDGIPENSGAPDQTFDDWRLQGVSAYCGGLWLAALEAAIALGTVLSDSGEDTIAEIATFRSWLDQSKPIYHEKLWNGDYYRIDSDSGSDVVMADQLCGQFYAQLLGLPDIVPPDCAQTALKTVYDACFVKFNDYLAQGGASGSDGRIPEATEQPLGRSPLPVGAANGVRPDGSPENANSTHPLEVWTGINFGLAAFLVQTGLETEGMAIAEAVVQQIYTSGLQFRTPEAITPNATFRACHYLRAMAIWAIYHVKAIAL